MGAHALAGTSLLLALRDPDASHKDAVFCKTEFAHVVRTRDWKLIHDARDRSELYHLKRDPGECTNLYGDPAVCEIERDLYRRLMDHLIRNRRSGFSRGRNGFFG